MHIKEEQAEYHECKYDSFEMLSPPCHLLSDSPDYDQYGMVRH